MQKTDDGNMGEKVMQSSFQGKQLLQVVHLFGCSRNARKGLAKNVNANKITITTTNSNTNTPNTPNTPDTPNTPGRDLLQIQTSVPFLQISSCVKSKSIVGAESGSIESDYNLCVLRPHHQLWVRTHYNKCSRLVFTEHKHSSCFIHIDIELKTLPRTIFCWP